MVSPGDIIRNPCLVGPNTSQTSNHPTTNLDPENDFVFVVHSGVLGGFVYDNLNNKSGMESHNHSLNIMKRLSPTLLNRNLQSDRQRSVRIVGTFFSGFFCPSPTFFTGDKDDMALEKYLPDQLSPKVFGLVSGQFGVKAQSNALVMLLLPLRYFEQVFGNYIRSQKMALSKYIHSMPLLTESMQPEISEHIIAKNVEADQEQSDHESNDNTKGFVDMSPNIDVAIFKELPPMNANVVIIRPREWPQVFP